MQGEPPQEVGGKDLGPDLRTIVELDGEGQVGASPIDDPLHQQLRLAAMAHTNVILITRWACVRVLRGERGLRGGGGLGVGAGGDICGGEHHLSTRGWWPK